MFKFFNLRLHEDGAEGGLVNTSGTESPATTQVVYGRPPEAAAEAAPESAASAPAVDPGNEWKEVKTKHKALYDAEVRDHVERRVKTTKAELRELKATLDPFMKVFGFADAKSLKDFALSELVSNVPGGYTPPTFDDADEGGQAPEVSLSPADLATQAVALAEKFAGFDLTQEQTALMPLLQKGLNLEQAYILQHFDDILQAETLKAAEAQKKATIESIRSRGLDKVDEEVSKPAPAVEYRSDPSTWSKEDMAKVKEMVRKGVPIPL
jgi:hypothetical protein